MGFICNAHLAIQQEHSKSIPYIINSVAWKRSRLQTYRNFFFFFWCSSRKKINKYNQSNILEKNVSVLFNPSLPIRILPFQSMYFCFGTGLLWLDMRIIFHHFAEKNKRWAPWIIFVSFILPYTASLSFIHVLCLYLPSSTLIYLNFLQLTSSTLIHHVLISFTFLSFNTLPCPSSIFFWPHLPSST